MTLAEVERLCVSRFERRDPRERLFYALEEFVQNFLREQIPCEIFVDGSFLTHKPDPDDVDVAVELEPDVANSLTKSQRQLIDSANSESYIAGVESFVETRWPIGHLQYELNRDEMTWGSHFGREHFGGWLKGTAVLRLGETSVGLWVRR
jgi:hypothetical protein